jgi:hypothetical protein
LLLLPQMLLHLAPLPQMPPLLLSSLTLHHPHVMLPPPLLLLLLLYCVDAKEGCLLKREKQGGEWGRGTGALPHWVWGENKQRLG